MNISFTPLDTGSSNIYVKRRLMPIVHVGGVQASCLMSILHNVAIYKATLLCVNQVCATFFNPVFSLIPLDKCTYDTILHRCEVARALPLAPLTGIKNTSDVHLNITQTFGEYWPCLLHEAVHSEV